MPSSELSNALNPNANQSRRYDYVTDLNPQTYDRVNTASYTSNRNSELELAIVEPSAPPRPRNVNPIQELLRVLAAAKEAELNERQRRIAWEQEQETKAAQKQADMERRLIDMQQEIAGLRAYISLMHPAPTTPLQAHAAGGTLVQQHAPSPSPQLENALSLAPVPVNHYPTFIQGSSTTPLDYPSIYGEDRLSTLSTSSVSSNSGGGAPADLAFLRKRPSPALSSTEGESSDEESTLSEGRPSKRVNGHDSRCLSIQHAMRIHIHRTMAIDEDHSLPDSHIEGAPLGQNEPIRFIWERTVKQSPHNAQMKARVIADIVENRQLYDLVPNKDFDPAFLDRVFEQAFTTLRRKFKAQCDASIASKRHKREATKSMRTRRLTRKRTKLGTRTTSRQKLERFSHSTFDGALQLDCMSSEESDGDKFSDPVSGLITQALRIRGLPWRSSRLLRLYTTLDEEYQFRVTTKRGATKKHKRIGPMKEGYLILPPKGVAGWMVSKQWLRNMGAVHKDLEDWLQPLLVERPGFDWSNFTDLGDETEDDGVENDGIHHSPLASGHLMHHMHVTSNSLQYALQL